MTETTLTRPSAHPAVHVGDRLREWRQARRLSQLDLALEAGISSRHLSYLETGKARPSREMVGQLAEALDIPLRDRNALLLAAGFAPLHRETPLSAPQMDLARRAIEFILRQHEPWPAFVMNRHWDAVMSNAGLDALFGRLRPGGPVHANILRQVFDPDDMRPVIDNWEEVAGDLIRHLHHEVAMAPTDAIARGLLDEVLAFPDIPQTWRRRELGVAPVPMMTTVFRCGDRRLSFFSTLTTFGTSSDITLEELRIECLFPADDDTASFCRSLAEPYTGMPRP